GGGGRGDMECGGRGSAGLEEAAPEAVESGMRQQTEQAVKAADIVLLLVDGRAGVTPLDRHFADWLRRSGRPIRLVVNKCEGSAAAAGLAEAWRLGPGEPLAISAEHGEGMGDLYDALAPHAAPSKSGPDEPEAEDEASDEEAEPRILQLAIVGRPNVGKSTLINRLLGEERLLTGPEAG